jgi:antagonist of KipI
MEITVRKAGFLTTVQDTGRIGQLQYGVSRGGAIDGHAARVVNTLAGNDGSLGLLEITSGTVRLHVKDARVLAWGGGEYRVLAGELPVPPGHTVLLKAGEEITFTGPNRGGRAWIAISGGVNVPLVLGSRATDLRGKFGGCQGRALQDGDILPLGENTKTAMKLIKSLEKEKLSSWTAPFDWVQPASRSALLRFIPSSHHNRFTSSAVRAFSNGTFEVSAQSDRMGIRFDGPVLERRDAGDLVSEPVALGTVQVPPDGHPILLLNDCQTVGGYPKLAHVITCDMARAAQLARGEEVRFSEISLAAAHQLLCQRERDFETFRIGFNLRVG